MLNYTYRKSSCKWGKVSPDFSTFLFQKEKKICHCRLFLLSARTVLNQKAKTVLNSDCTHMPQAFKGHLVSSCPSEPKAFPGIRNTSVLSTFPRQGGIYFLPCIKVPFKRLLYPFILATSTLGFPDSTIWNDTPNSNIAESWKGDHTEEKKKILKVSCRAISISSSLLDKYIKFR